MTDYLSNKIRNLSGLSILMVIYIHMYYTEGKTMSVLSAVEGFIGSGLCTVAVPIFYVFSGYLFFLNMPLGIWSIGSKLKKRCHTLLVPYMITNVLTFLFYITLNLVTLYVSTIDRVVNFHLIETMMNLGLWGTLKFVFVSPPIAFQLWFVRDLMFVMLFSPVVYLIINKLQTKKCSNLWLLLLAILYVLLYKIKLVAAFVWFSLGAFLSICHINIECKGVRWLSVSAIFLYVTLSALKVVGIYAWSGIFIPLFGIPALWFGYDLFARHKSYNNLLWLTNSSFFIYLIHEPLLNIFKKLPLLINRSQPTLILCYLLIPPIFYILACLLSIALKKIFPKAYMVFTGGR